jgi:hypothetical protein
MLNPSGRRLGAREESISQDAELARVLELCLVAIESGRHIDPAQMAAAHPRIAPRLQTCLITLDLVRQAAAALAPSGNGQVPEHYQQRFSRWTVVPGRPPFNRQG